MGNGWDKAMDISDKLFTHTDGILSDLSEPKRKTEEFLYSIIKDKGQISEEDFKKAALMLNVRKIHRQLKNYYKVLEKSDTLIEKTKLPSKQISSPTDDWLEYFEDLSSKVSDNSMQEIWARILTKERCDTGSITKVMLNTFSLLDKESALAFGKLCNLTYKLTVDDGRIRYIPLVLYDDILHGIVDRYKGQTDYQKVIIPFEEYQKFLPKQEEIEYLSELNLIKLSEVHDESEIYSHNPMKLTFSVKELSFESCSLHSSEENYNFICTGQAFFTQTGLALYHALAFEPYSYLFDVLKGYISYTADNWSDVQ
jgi:hypothetical protein